MKILENIGNYNTGKTVEEAIEQDTLYERNTAITDKFGNKITIPAGFKIVKDNPTDPTPSVKDGIVIQDAIYEGTFGSEFVWIPVGDIKKSETEIVKINLSRYTFDSEGNEIDQGSNEIIAQYSFTEDTQKNHGADYKNEIATDIEDFKLKASTERSGGYYIARYEARVENSTLNEKDIENPGAYGNYIGSNNMWTAYMGGQLVIKPNSQVWNYVTQNKAAELSKNMYIGETFTSDLMNSYAWDTAIVFIQKCSENTKYSRQNSLNTGSPANQGTNNLATDKQDKICNIWDMASNCWEYTTETSRNIDNPCVRRGGYFIWNADYTSYRHGGGMTIATSRNTFRPLLYL